MNEENTVTITQEEYQDLLKDSLENGGVDNWEWYDESLKEFWEEED